MIKDKLHTISDADAIEVAKILLKTSTSYFYDFVYEKITRIKYDNQDGTDAEESVNVYFNATVRDDMYRNSGWKDERIFIKLIEHDRYHDYPYFYANSIQEPVVAERKSTTWKNKFLSNHIEAIEYLQKLQLI